MNLKQANAAPPTHSPYVQHMPPGPQMMPPQQMSTSQAQSSVIKENGFYKRVSKETKKKKTIYLCYKISFVFFYFCIKYSDVNKTVARPTDSVPEPKKARYDMNATNTKVVSLRNIPNDITDLQVVFIGLEFGDVVNILYIKAKGQVII